MRMYMTGFQPSAIKFLDSLTTFLEDYIINIT